MDQKIQNALDDFKEILEALNEPIMDEHGHEIGSIVDDFDDASLAGIACCIQLSAAMGSINLDTVNIERGLERIAVELAPKVFK